MLFSIINVVRSLQREELAFRGERGSLLGEPAGSSISLYFPAGVKFLQRRSTNGFKQLIKKQQVTIRAYLKKQK
ncbi:hypothetical protein HMPREF3291_09530 [Bacillus sp. HMSC76G11]|nr:hypothetical protein HMPREF3291_09530 [Bacillus sp. HMSC76G11]